MPAFWRISHVSSIGVPAKEKANDYFQTHTAEFDWNYTGEQLQNQ